MIDLMIEELFINDPEKNVPEMPNNIGKPGGYADQGWCDDHPL